VHQVLHARCLGGVGDGLALGDLVGVGGLDAVGAIRAAHRRVDGGTVVQVASDELGSGGGERGGGRGGGVADQGANVPAVGEQVAGGGPALVSGGAGDEDGVAVSVHGGLLQ
jgi:hypothetical protein